MQRISCNSVKILKSCKHKIIFKISQNLHIYKAFTLVEMIVVVLIVWVLFGLLAKVYITSTKLYVYQKHLKNIEKDILFFNQNIQNLVDTMQIDYNKYTSLDDNLWFTGNLYLTWNWIWYKVYLSWEQVYLDKIKWLNIENIPLTSSWQTVVKDLKFKIIPFKDPYKIAGYWETAMQPFVKIFMDIQNKYYNTWHWENALNYKFEEWFNFKYYQN